jgi:hypothetical protein
METIWSIQQLNRDLSDGLVTIAHWRCTVTDGIQSANNNGAVGFERGDTFTNYSDLTETQVLDWVKSKLNVSEIEIGLQSHIEGLKNPICAIGVPWQQPPAKDY